MSKQWLEYEIKVFDAIKSIYLQDTVLHDHKIRGIYSNQSRQIDIYVEQRTGDIVHRIIFDCKKYKQPVDIKRVESFIAMVKDVGADHGIIVSESGFTASANKRAFEDPEGVELDIYNFAELTHNFQAEAALPHNGSRGVLLRAPFGWIVDGKQSQFLSPALLYKRGLTPEQAIESQEFAYVNFWNTKRDPMTASQLSEYQLKAMRESHRFLSSSQMDVVTAYNHAAILRTVEYDGGLVEVTGLVSFDDFIFFCVCLSPALFRKRAQRKIALVLRYALPISVRRQDADHTAS